MSIGFGLESHLTYMHSLVGHILEGYLPNWKNWRNTRLHQGKGHGNPRMWSSEEGHRENADTGKNNGALQYQASQRREKARLFWRLEGDEKEKEASNGPLAWFGGLTSAQLEEVYAQFKEKETQECVINKNYDVVTI